MAELREDGTYECKYCGLTSPRGHWRPLSWIQKHEENCPANPKHNQEK